MLRTSCVAILMLALACSAAPTQDPEPPPDPTPAEPPPATGELRWAQVQPELEALFCLKTFDIPGHGGIEEPMPGDRALCELAPAATPLERAVETAWKDASTLLGGFYRATREPLLAAMAAPSEQRQAAVRQAYFSERIVGVLMSRLVPALASEGLRCVDCPASFVPEPRTIDWATFAPYLAAYAWPDPVVTPLDARGKPAGEPKYSAHICVGTNGIDELPEPDVALVELGFFAAFHNEHFRERAFALFREIREEAEFKRLRDDAARTQWLRDHLGTRLVAEPEIQRTACEVVDRFRPDTGIEVRECETFRAP
jgi:hypothetical protein